MLLPVKVIPLRVAAVVVPRFTAATKVPAVFRSVAASNPCWVKVIAASGAALVKFQTVLSVMPAKSLPEASLITPVGIST